MSILKVLGFVYHTVSSVSESLATAHRRIFEISCQVTLCTFYLNLNSQRNIKQKKAQKQPLVNLSVVIREYCVLKFPGHFGNSAEFLNQNRKFPEHYEMSSKNKQTNKKQ